MFLFQVIDGEPPKHREAHIQEQWFRQIAEGSTVAFECLYRETDRIVYAYALSILKHPQDAEDVMQDSYLKIRAAAGLYKPQGKPLAWILTIVRNFCLMKLRQKNKKDEPLEEADAFSYIEDHEDRQVLLMALKILKEDERKILLLHAVSGLKHREIADNIGMPLSTVLSKYRRALKKLKNHLTEQEGFEYGR